MTAGIYERKSKEATCPKCGLIYAQKKVTGKPCPICQKKQQWANYINGAGANRRRRHSKGERMETNVRAMYIGDGSFYADGRIVAFVNQRNREQFNLVAGRTYHLKAEKVPFAPGYKAGFGLVFKVLGEAKQVSA
jgi:hypothetical protein